MNPNSQYSTEDSFRDMIHVEPQEALDTAGEPVPSDEDGSGDSDASINEDYEGYYERQYGWPGDGSGEDDFADMNANEVDDYQNE